MSKVDIFKAFLKYRKQTTLLEGILIIGVFFMGTLLLSMFHYEHYLVISMALSFSTMVLIKGVHFTHFAKEKKQLQRRRP